MAHIDGPAGCNLGPHIDWSLHRPEMAAGLGALSEAVYGNTRLTTREREAARWTIATINSCAVCLDTRAARAETDGVDESFYAAVSDWPESAELSERERLAAEYAQRFAVDHTGLDDEFWQRMREQFDDGEIADLTMCVGTFLGLGRMLAVLRVPAPEEGILV